jgi:hypothetical protein
MMRTKIVRNLIGLERITFLAIKKKLVSKYWNNVLSISNSKAFENKDETSFPI